MMMWLALLGRLNTKGQLRRKGILPMEANTCSFCDSLVESLDHLLVSCNISWQIWCVFSIELRNPIIIPGTLRQLYDVWMNQRMHGRTKKKYWMLTFFGVTWSLWMLRNSIVFEQQNLNIDAVICTIKWRIAFWSKAWNEEVPYSG